MYMIKYSIHKGGLKIHNVIRRYTYAVKVHTGQRCAYKKMYVQSTEEMIAGKSMDHTETHESATGCR